MVRDASGDARGGRQGRWRRLPLHVERLSRGQWLEVPAWMFDRARCLDPSPLTASPFVSMDALRSSAAGIEAAAVIIECAAFWRIQLLSRAELGSAVRLKRPVSFTSPCYDRRCYNSRNSFAASKTSSVARTGPANWRAFWGSSGKSRGSKKSAWWGRQELHLRPDDYERSAGSEGFRTSNHRYERSALTVERPGR